MSGYSGGPNPVAANLPAGIDAAKIADGSVSNTEFQYINTLSSNAQTQITANVTAIALRKTLQYILTGVDVNSAGADVGTFTGLPAKYIIRKLTAFDASTGLTLAAIDLRTASGGGGTTLVNGFVLSALTGATSYVDCTLATAAATTYQTGTSLFVRNTIAQGGAATISLCLEIEVLS